MGVLEAPSPKSSPGLESGGVCTRDPLAFLALIGADIEGRREFVRLSGRPSSSLSPLLAPAREIAVTLESFHKALTCRPPTHSQQQQTIKSIRDGVHTLCVALSVVLFVALQHLVLNKFDNLAQGEGLLAGAAHQHVVVAVRGVRRLRICCEKSTRSWWRISQ